MEQDTAEPQDTAEDLSIDPNEDDADIREVSDPIKGCSSGALLVPWLWLLPAFLIWRDNRKYRN